MGPRSYERGISHTDRRAAPGDPRFNGAAFLRTRNRRTTWRTASSTVGFNGAAFLRTRNRAPISGHADLGPRASMGPRSYERGIATYRCRGRDRDLWLQWGRVLTNAESLPWSWDHLKVVALQWGRVLTNAESRLPAETWRSRGAASMGPRSYERGIVGTALVAVGIAALQWGRVLTNAESSW